ncbi:MAG TPA: outer membrane beta-barrel protein, partial [Thermoanaerobaculia bacterium]|nr:outer membrane beta-barrel protein [Thermoanaerobaculia bacterium]
LAVERAWTNRITSVLSIGAERQRQNSSYSVEPPTPNQPFTRYIFQRTYRTTYPLDFLARYHFVTESRWTPYFGIGARYVNGPGTNTKVTEGFDGVFRVESTRYQDRTSAEVNGGVIFRITPHVGLQIDGKRLLRSDGVNYDPINKVSVGVSWRF